MSFIRSGLYREEDPRTVSWSRSLGEFDALAGAGADPDQLERILNRLEKRAEGVESRLSLLKRRRALSGRGSRFLNAYRDAARKAADDFPYSRPLAALAAAALVHDSPMIGIPAEELRKRILLLEDGASSPLVLAVRILQGDMRNIERARASPRLEALFSGAFPLVSGGMAAEEAEALIVNFAILDILNGDVREAAARIILADGGETIRARSPAFLRFAAEYYYDFGDPLRAAGIFSRLEGENALIREADSLWLAGYHEAAGNIWKALVSPERTADSAVQAASAAPAAPVSGAVRVRSLYNLAAVSDGAEAAAWLERLYAERGAGFTEPAGPGPHTDALRFGIIRYTRLLPLPQALAVLDDAALKTDPFLDLELLRRREELWIPGRVTGETWLLLGRHPGARELYRWAAWYFDHQREYGETSRLVRTAENRGINGPWLSLHRAISFIAEGNLDRAEEALSAVPESVWQAPANLGLIMEARRSPSAALSRYETAVSAMEKSGVNRAEAARLQLRIAGCFGVMGRPEESRRVLEYARDLDPENLTVQMELRRLTGAGRP
jgi:tetratricopeptide (TPR) repeat protein